MLIDDLVQKIRTNMWAVESDYETGSVQTMLSPSEVKMLEWLGRNHPLNDNAVIVDAGAFLGGSTAALASGLEKNQAKGRIHSYDMFLAPNNVYSQGLIGNRPAGTSVLDIFTKNLGHRIDKVTVHAGDFAAAPVPTHPIGILFIDVAKTWELNQRVISAYFPLMIPGQTIIIQQDHNDQSCPWINVTMEFFADYFDYLTDDGGSRVFLYTKAIPPELLNTSLKTLPTEEKINLAKHAASRSKDSVSAYLSSTSVAWLIAEQSFDRARAYLSELVPSQPWQSESPYVTHIHAAMAAVEAKGHDYFTKNYFKRRSRIKALWRTLFPAKRPLPR